MVLKLCSAKEAIALASWLLSNNTSLSMLVNQTPRISGVTAIPIPRGIRLSPKLKKKIITSLAIFIF